VPIFIIAQVFQPTPRVNLKKVASFFLMFIAIAIIFRSFRLRFNSEAPHRQAQHHTLIHHPPPHQSN